MRLTYVFNPPKLSVYLSSLLSLLIATMLGFLDDVFDIRWRHKLPIPIIASIPLLMVYYAERGNTHVVVPLPLRPIFGALVNLGKLSLNYNVTIVLLFYDIIRAPILRLHVPSLHIYNKQYQHPRRYKRL